MVSNKTGASITTYWSFFTKQTLHNCLRISLNINLLVMEVNIFLFCGFLKTVNIGEISYQHQLMPVYLSLDLLIQPRELICQTSQQPFYRQVSLEPKFVSKFHRNQLFLFSKIRENICWLLICHTQYHLKDYSFN